MVPPASDAPGPADRRNTAPTPPRGVYAEMDGPVYAHTGAHHPPTVTSASSSRPAPGNSASLPLPDQAYAQPGHPARPASVPQQQRRLLPAGAGYAPEVQHALRLDAQAGSGYSPQRTPMLLPNPPVHSPMQDDDLDPTRAASHRVNYSRPLAPSPGQGPPLHTRRSFVGPSPAASPAGSTAPTPSAHVPRIPSSTRAAAASGLSLSTQLPAFIPAPAFSPEDRGPYPPLSSPTRAPGEQPEYLFSVNGGAAEGRPGSLAFDAPVQATSFLDDMAGVGTRASVFTSGPGASTPAQRASAAAKSPQLVAPSPYASAPASAGLVSPAPASAPVQVAPPPHLVPQPEVCVECMMRDRDMADVQVIGSGVWDRESDAEWASQCRWEAEGDEQGSAESGRRSVYERESASGRSSCVQLAGAGAGGGRRRFGRGQLLTSGNLKVWTTMNPPAAAHRWRTLQTFLATQAHYLELERQARQRETAPSPVPPIVEPARNRSSSLLSPTSLAAEKAALEHEERVALRAIKSRSRATLADETNRHSSASLFPPPSLNGSIGAAPHPPFAGSGAAASSGSSMRSYSAGDQPWLGSTLRRLSSPSGAGGGAQSLSTSPPKSPATSFASGRFAFPNFARSTTDLRSLPGASGTGATRRSVSPARTSGDTRRTSVWSRFRQSASASVLSFAPSGSMMDMHLGLSQDKHQGLAAQYGAYGQPLYDTYAAMSDPAVARHADRRERDRVLAAAAAKEAAGDAGDAGGGAAGAKKKKKGLKGFLNKLVGGGRRDRAPSVSAPATPSLDGDVPFDAALGGGDDDELAPPPPLSALAKEPRYHHRSASNSSIDSYGPYTPPLPPAQQFRSSYAMPMPGSTAAADRQSILTLGSFTSTRSKPTMGGGGGRTPTLASRNSYGRPSLDSLRDQGSFQRPGSFVGGPADGDQPEVLAAREHDDELDLRGDAPSHSQPPFQPTQPRPQKSLPLLPSEATHRTPPPLSTWFDPHAFPATSYDAHPPNLPYAHYGVSRSAYSLSSQHSLAQDFALRGAHGTGAGEARNATVTGAGGEHTVRKSRSRAKVFSLHFGFGGGGGKKAGSGAGGDAPPLPLAAPGAQAMRGASLDSPALLRYGGAYEARPIEGLVSLR